MPLKKPFLQSFFRKDDFNIEDPIGYMSQSLFDDKLKYSLIEKHAFSLIKAIENFGHFILGKHTGIKVPLHATNFLLSKCIYLESLHWLAEIKEYDFRITTSNTIKGNDLALHWLNILN